MHVSDANTSFGRVMTVGYAKWGWFTSSACATLGNSVVCNFIVDRDEVQMQSIGMNSEKID